MHLKYFVRCVCVPSIHMFITERYFVATSVASFAHDNRMNYWDSRTCTLHPQDKPDTEPPEHFYYFSKMFYHLNTGFVP